MKKHLSAENNTGYNSRVYPFFLMIFLAFMQTASAQERNRVKILSPSPGDGVGSRGQVTVSANINDDSHVWVLVHMALLPDQWWPQHQATLDAEGNWRSLVFYGQKEDLGLDFEIAVATFRGEEEQKILNYHKRGRVNNDYLPIKFPMPTSNVDIVTVRKSSH